MSCSKEKEGERRGRKVPPEEEVGGELDGKTEATDDSNSKSYFPHFVLVSVFLQWGVWK